MVPLRNLSNSPRFTSFFFPTYSTNLQFGIFNSSSIRLISILEYSAASLIVKLDFSHIGILLVTYLPFTFDIPSCTLNSRVDILCLNILFRQITVLHSFTLPCILLGSRLVHYFLLSNPIYQKQYQFHHHTISSQKITLYFGTRHLSMHMK